MSPPTSDFQRAMTDLVSRLRARCEAKSKSPKEGRCVCVPCYAADVIETNIVNARAAR